MKEYSLIDKSRAITSYGIILFSVVNNSLKYLVTQRRDSISFAEFLKNNLSHDIIPYHIKLMSKEEKLRCLHCYQKDDFKTLWDDLWINHNCRVYQTEMRNCCVNFKDNMKKYLHLFEDENIGQYENQWGFPKGRKHHNENETTCALREFEEETMINKYDITLFNSKRHPYEEYYKGTDNKLYKSVFFLANIEKIPNIIPKRTDSSIRKTYISGEVSQMKWVEYHEAINILNSNKTKILKHIEHFLLFKKKRHVKVRKSI